MSTPSPSPHTSHEISRIVNQVVSRKPAQRNAAERAIRQIAPEDIAPLVKALARRASLIKMARRRYVLYCVGMGALTGLFFWIIKLLDQYPHAASFSVTLAIVQTFIALLSQRKILNNQANYLTTALTCIDSPTTIGPLVEAFPTG